MSHSSQAPRLFDVMPAGELRRALRQSLPSSTELAWLHIGNLNVTEGSLGVVDATCCHPRHYREAKTLEWPFPLVEVWLQLARTPGAKLDRVFAVLLSAAGEGMTAGDGNWQTKESVSMPIDSASAVVADFGRLKSDCRDGGPLSETYLGKGSADEAPAKQARQQAAALLAQHGFPTKLDTWATGSISISFSPGLTDERVAAANELLAKAGFSDRAWIAGSHTSGEVAAGLTTACYTRVPRDDNPFGYAFTTGFGDGMYYWDSLWRDGKLCGYLCNFVPADEEEDRQGNEVALELAPLEAVAADSCPTDDAIEVLELESAEEGRESIPAAQAPPTRPGALVAVRGALDTYWIARVEQELPGGWTVQYPSGNRENVQAGNVIPIPDRPVFQVGDVVLALWRAPAMYPGRITAISPQGYTVAWLDGDQPQVVALGTLTFLAWTSR